MYIHILGQDLSFPPVTEATREGIVAIGGDLTPKRLLKAYQQGIFPWYCENDPIIWWSPDPRMVIFLRDLHVSRSMQRVIKRKQFLLTYDKEFVRVVKECQKSRSNQDGTWITRDMVEAYVTLHKLGYAHSVEVWEKNTLAGGIYGVSLGRAFFGESMFTRVNNASKFGLIQLVLDLRKRGYDFLDCQVSSNHLVQLGAAEISRDNFIKCLKKSLKYETLRGKWHFKSDIPSPFE